MVSEDFDDCQALWRRCSGLVQREWENRAALAALVTRNPGGCWLAQQHDQLLGTILAGHDGWRGYIYHLAVDPRWQRKGLGAKLTREALTYFASHGIQRSHTLVRKDNPEGDAFWRAMGATPRSDVNLFTLSATEIY